VADADRNLFHVSGEHYDRLIGRYSGQLAVAFADACGVAAGRTALDLGCGPGALTTELVHRLGAASVAAIDPSEPFAAECRRRNAGVDVRVGSAESLPFADASFDAVLAQLVLHFVAGPETAASEMRRVLRPGGVAAACVWDFGGGMVLLRTFWEAALALDPQAPAEQQTRRFGRDGDIAALLGAAGFRDVVGGALDVEARYDGFDDLWSGFLGGVGPVGAYVQALTEDRREELRVALGRVLGERSGPFTLPARAWYAAGIRPAV
jgi:SAM-dependent methyltransferase